MKALGRRLVYLGLGFIGSIAFVYGQDAGQVLRGYVVDESGEGLIGAHVTVPTLGIGTVAGIEGYYELKDIPVGVYEVLYSYVSYESRRVFDVKIQANAPTDLRISLNMDAQVLEAVEIAADRLTDNAEAMIDLQKKSIHLMEGLAVDEMGKKGDNALGSAVRRMAGVSVEGGKYFYVRGLGDRYNSVYVNGAYIPSLDPDRNAIQLDLFPSYLVENLVLYKAFSADLPGNFAGGHMDVSLKSIPHSRLLNVSYATRYNDRTHFNDQFLAYTGSSTDWLGFDNGSRALPTLIKQNGVPSILNATTNAEAGKRLQSATNAFHSNQMSPIARRVGLDQRFNFAYGNKHHLFGRPLGYLLSLTYANAKNSYRDGNAGTYGPIGQQSRRLETLLNLDDHRSTQSALLGGLLSLGVEVAPDNHVSVSLLHNQKGESTARSQEGENPGNDSDIHYITHGLWYTEKSLSTLQIKGKHAVGSRRLWHLDWISAGTRARIENPDLRFFTYTYRKPLIDGTKYTIQPSNGQIPTRYFRDMQEDIWDNRLHVRRNWREDGTSYLKGGLAYSHKTRFFREEQYRYDQTYTTYVPGGDPSAYVATGNLWSREANPGGVYLVDETIPANNYEGNQRVMAGYLMQLARLHPKWELNTGLRYEYTELDLRSEDNTKGAAYLRNHDLLPAFTLTHRTTPSINLRALYGRTLARPTFRELAPYESFDFIGDYILVGNPNLQRTRIDNFDVRAEYFPNKGELLSLSLFYKQFHQPIERTFNPETQGTELTFRNVEQATLMGAEINATKGLNFISPALHHTTLGLNAAWIHSAVRIDPKELALIQAYNPNAQSTRPMFGQSPYIINASIGHVIKSIGIETQLYYHIFGERIALVTEGGSPDVYEKPRHDMGLTVSKKWNRMRLRARFNNLLDAPYKFMQTIKGREYIFRRYQVGRNYSLSLSYAI